MKFQFSKRLPYTAAEVWAAVGDFCSLGDWYPDILACECSIVDGATVRTIEAEDGEKFVERLVNIDADNHSYCYELVSGDLDVIEYTVQFSIGEIGINREECEIKFDVSYVPANSSLDQLQEDIQEIYDLAASGILSFMASRPRVSAG